MGVSALFFIVPVTLFTAFTATREAGFPLGMVVGFPIFCLVFGYLMIAVGCWVYNTLVRDTGALSSTPAMSRDDRPGKRWILDG